ncbi:MAG: UDP-N-acetylglucosamine--N-acetylmuramyl-(pentapeptide) pyrophosphoryl-undecaprenol [Parcubacteria group bacterium]|nr:UDP-N-acetylglucosamine--N-acetylmuramyl-(pentapeptide) pyrophosphoryl-undecaprenol [Parcubacteria group bacterium]
MKIVFAGGGTGGHFYPIIAIAEAVRDVVRERHLIEPKMYFMAPKPFDPEALFENEITFVACPAGKMRRYVSFQNFTDLFITAGGVISALITLFRITPDVVISKGGYTSVPITIAANILGLPVIIHESDAKPGRANLLAAKHAARIAVAFDSAREYFPKKVQDRIARIGIPIRKEVAFIDPEGAYQELGLERDIPTILIFGGSSGSAKINEVVLSALPDLISFANVIHQTGKDLFVEVESTSKVVLGGSANGSRYHVFPYLSALSIRRAAGAATIVISRAGATAISEISLWRKPAILIPIPEAVSHDQRTNAYAYAHTGAAVVLEESNLTQHVLASEARRIATDPALVASMGAKGADFANPDAARMIAEEVLSIALSHEPEQSIS